MRSTIAISFTALVALLGAASAHSAEPVRRGPYAGLGFGVSDFDIDRVSATRTVDNGVLRLYGGYRLTSRFGVEAGYLRTGHFVEMRQVDGVELSIEARTRALYVAATGRLPVTEAIAVTGRIGIASGDVNNNDEIVPGPDGAFGSKSSVMVGLGAEFRLSDRMSLALDADNIAAQSRRVSTRALTLSVKRTL